MVTNPSPIDCARLAAYIDSDGMIRISRTDREDGGYTAFRLEVSLFNCDPRLHEWCKLAFGCGVVHARFRQKRPTHRQQFMWKVCSKQAEEILQLCLPYFIIKRDQAEIGLAFRRTYCETNKAGKGRPVSDEVNDIRDAMRKEISRLKHVDYVDHVVVQ